MSTIETGTAQAVNAGDGAGLAIRRLAPARCIRKPAIGSGWALQRFTACLLAFVSGAAAMFGVDRAGVVHVQPAPKVAQQASPAFLEATDTSPPADRIAVAEVTVPATADESNSEAPDASATNMLRVPGTTEPASGRYAKLPLATSQAVAFVDVKPGDRVKKGWQVFSHWESPERLQAVKTEMERTKKLFEVAKVRSTAADQTVQRLKTLHASVSAQELQDAETTATIRQGELEAAQLAVAQAESHFTAMEFEFTQAFVTSPIDGIVASVDVVPGERRQLSGPFRGVTVLDTSVLYCRCLLNQEQLSALQRLLPADGRTATETAPSSDATNRKIRATVEWGNKEMNATVVWIGVQAEAGTGLIPVLLEVKNPAEILRCGIQCNVCFQAN